MRHALLTLATACSFRGPALAPADGDLSPDAIVVPACVGAACDRVRIAIHHELVAAPLTDFPVLLHVTGLAGAAPTGFDLVFTDGVTRLAYERERFSGGDLLAWVAVPALSAATDTILYLYSGDPNPTVDQQDPTHVWDAHFEGVWHLDGTARGSADVVVATSHADHGTDIGNPMLGVPGKIGGAVGFDGIDDGLGIPASPGLGLAGTTGTISLWVRWAMSNKPTSQRLLMTSNTFAGDGNGYEWAINNLDYYYFYPADAGAENYLASLDPFLDTAWHLAALTLDLAARSVGMFVDGRRLSPVIDNLPQWWTRTATSGDWLWGGGPTRRLFEGAMDELHVSSTVRSDAWLTTEWNDQHDPDAFAAITR